MGTHLFPSPEPKLTPARRHFVPNITMGAPILTCVKKGVPDIFMDCHMMVADPIKVRTSSFLLASLRVNGRTSG